MNSTEDQHKTIWLGGLPMVGTRPFTDSERATLQGVARRCLRKFIIALLASPTVFLTFMGLAAVFDAGDGRMSPFVVPAVLSIVFGPAVSILVMRDAWRRRKSVLGDLRDGALWVFERSDAADPSQQLRIETLPVSQAVWTLNGVRPAKWTPAIPGEVAETPEYAATAAEWVQPAVPDDKFSTHYNHRELSATERVELASHIRQARWSAVPLLLLLNAIIGGVAYASISAHKWPPPSMIYVLAVYVPIGDIRQAKLWWHAARLSRDLAIGRVIIARVPLGEQDSGELSDALEFLPVSKFDWTKAGRPARWRLSPADRRKRK